MSIKAILGSVLRRGLTRNLGEETLSIDQALLAIHTELKEAIESLKKGKQGCVGFIEDDGEHNQVIDQVLKILDEKMGVK